jgi:hypothetical protein
MAGTEWATIADVTTVTGKTATQAQRDQAARILEATHGLIEMIDRPDITDRDRYFLKLACAYQAAFMIDNPDIFTRNDVTSANQDGDSAAFRNVDSHLVAPLARKAMRRLSWRGIRALTPGGGTPPRTPLVDVNSEAYDNLLPWSPV